MKTIDLILDLLFFCFSIVRICIGVGEAYDCVVMFFTTSFLLYEIGKRFQLADKKNKPDSKSNE